eukprot:Tamp_10657.p1 GENE.Tamp_10657~~Tamp_10657.p1  ORF type:complete len:562 (+),score=108.24 Tamp_10657:2-1687(+)
MQDGVDVGRVSSGKHAGDADDAAGVEEGQELEEVYTAEWEAEMQEYGYTQAQIAKMKRGEWDEDEAPGETPTATAGGARAADSKGAGGGEGGEEGELGELEGFDQAGLQDGEVEVVTLAVEGWEKLSREKFWDHYMLPNRPVVIEGYVARCPCPARARVHARAHCEQDGGDAEPGDDDGGEAGESAIGWRAWREWVTEDGALNSRLLRDKFGHVCVTAHNCARRVRGMDELMTRQMTVAQFLDWWDGPRAAGNGADVDLFYLKDWNFAKEFPGYGLYVCPPWFEEDWLNEYEAAGASDHRFVYLGPAGSYTPLHRDTLHSFSWSANVSGTKMWWMLPPQCTAALHDGEGKQLFDVRQVDEARFPLFKAAAAKHLIHFQQAPGEIVFVPSGWWHQVENLTDALSINHNWVNAANVGHSWRLLQDTRTKIASELPLDCEETYEEVLNFRLGWNFSAFRDFLTATLSRELELASRLVMRRGLRDTGDAGQRDETRKGEGRDDEPSQSHSQSATRLRLLGLTRLQQILRDLDRRSDAKLPSGLAATLERVTRMRESLTHCLAAPQ